MLVPSKRVFGIAEGDPYYNSVDVLLPLTTDETDAGPSSRTITVNGTPSYSSAGAALNGSTDYFNYQGVAIGSDDFIIEGRFTFDTISTAMLLFDYRPSFTQGAYPALVLQSTGYLQYYVNTAAQITSTFTLSTATEYYIAVFRKSGTTYLQIDGTIHGSWADTNVYLCPTDRPYIGTQSHSSAAFVDGTIRDFRVTIGTDRGRAASISGSTAYVPSSPFPTS